MEKRMKQHSINVSECMIKCCKAALALICFTSLERDDGLAEFFDHVNSSPFYSHHCFFYHTNNFSFNSDTNISCLYVHGNHKLVHKNKVLGLLFERKTNG